MNDAARDFPGHLSLFCTLHPEKLPQWQQQRALAGRNIDYLTVSPKTHKGAQVDRVIPETWAGSSGLYVCTVALLHLGYESVVLCGIPMDKRPHFHNEKDWTHYKEFQRWWERAAQSPELKGRIKSMSGWTRELFGES